MPLHPEARALLDQLEALGDPPLETSTPEAVRALRASRIQPPTVALAEVRDVDANGIATRLYRPSMDAPLGLMAYFRGGGRAATVGPGPDRAGGSDRQSGG